MINTYASGWSKELNLVEWNGNNATRHKGLGAVPRAHEQRNNVAQR
ncbi:MAG: hypothetical protein ACLSFO_01370 [Anaerovoracaceae bacterium]